MNYVMLAWLIAQGLKVILVFIETKRIDFSRLMGSGGMPSSHSASTAALVTAIGRECGAASPIFALAMTFALVVMYDAAGVRLAAGKQAKVLNKIVDHWEEKPPELLNEELKELIGHTPFQVFAGAILGFLIVILFKV